MAKDIQALITTLGTLPDFKKTAAMGEDLKDPAEQGTKTDVGGDAASVDTKDVKGAAGTSTGDLPETDPKVEPAAGEKAPEGSAAGEVPAATAFVEPKKASDFREGLSGLRSKLAAAVTVTPAEPAGDQAKAAGDPETPTADKVAAEASELSVSARVFRALMKTASGRHLVEDAIADDLGRQEAAELIKLAAEDIDAKEAAELNAKLAWLEEQEELQTLAQIQEAQAAQYAELLKTAETDEDRRKIAAHYMIGEQLKTKYAAENISDEEAFHAFNGFELGNKIAAAMAGGMPPEEAMPMPEGEPSIEEIEAALAELVATGQIPEEVALQLLQELAGEVGGEEAGAPLPPGMENMDKAAAVDLNVEVTEHLKEVNTFTGTLFETADA